MYEVKIRGQAAREPESCNKVLKLRVSGMHRANDSFVEHFDCNILVASFATILVKPNLKDDASKLKK